MKSTLEQGQVITSCTQSKLLKVGPGYTPSPTTRGGIDKQYISNDVIEILSREITDLNKQLRKKDRELELTKLDAQLARDTICEYAEEVKKQRNEIKKLSMKKRIRW